MVGVVDWFRGLTPLGWVVMVAIPVVIGIGYFHFFVATWTPYEPPATMVAPTVPVTQPPTGHPTPRPFFAQPERTPARPTPVTVPYTTTTILTPLSPELPALNQTQAWDMMEDLMEDMRIREENLLSMEFEQPTELYSRTTPPPVVHRTFIPQIMNRTEVPPRGGCITNRTCAGGGLG